MSLRRRIAGAFAVGSVALALLVPASVGGSLLAQAEETADCENGEKLCKETESCVGWFWAKTCTTYYFYWPQKESSDTGEDDVLESEDLEA